jgi:hypothetical protein
VDAVKARVSEYRTCLKGCTICGQHLTTCDGTCTGCKSPGVHLKDHHGKPRCKGACPGCLPRQAEFGGLCPWCWQRLHADIIDAAPLVKHLRYLAQPTAGTTPPGDGRTQSDPAHGSILSAAVDAADAVHALLAAYAQIILEEHPHGRVMAGPDERGVVITKSTIHSDAYGTYVQKATVMGIRDAEATARLVKWLLPFLPWCAEQEWAGVMRTELADIISTTMARWPVAETRMVKVKDTLCPRCDRATLTYMPPQVLRAELVIACSNPDCARIFREDEYARLIGLLDDAERKVG